MTKIEDLYQSSGVVDVVAMKKEDEELKQRAELTQMEELEEVEERNVDFPAPNRTSTNPFSVDVGITTENSTQRFGLEESILKDDVGTTAVKNTLLDNFLDDILDLYQPEEMDKFHFTENIQHDFYVGPEVIVDYGYVTKVIDAAFEAYPDRISFSVEELGLHNRLIDLQGVSREGNQYVLIKSVKGDIVVNKTRTRNGNPIIGKLLEEAKECLRLGRRMEMTLLESYKIKDSHDMEQTRFRFRASLAEIKEVIKITKMKGTITRDCFLVIYE